GILVQDNNVPFVKTIARVTRNSAGTMVEYRLPVEMPALLGAGAEFIPLSSVPHYTNHVFKLDDLNSDSTLVGYIFGGISSTAPNIFFTNTGSESSASNQIFKVYVIKNAALGMDELNDQSIGTLHLTVFPNPGNGDFKVVFNLIRESEIKITLYSMDGKKIEEVTLNDLQIGENTFERRIEGLKPGAMYMLNIETDYEKATRKVIVRR
ncbi:MAG TPA: T9SS C-terminal target domain-containing protein, partial [Bacteroidetes bacterium]|nr:T9SS C-terminal target domain-containing protein [Bacteroidota bacterium]